MYKTIGGKETAHAEREREESESLKLNSFTKN